MKGYSFVMPCMDYEVGKRLLDIRGRSCPKSPIKFYDALIQSVEELGNSGHEQVAVNIAFEYFNKSSSKCVYLLFEKLEHIYQLGKRVNINWYFEVGDEDMQESGEDLTSFFEVPVDFVEIPEIEILGNKKDDPKRKMVV